jgi:hypothetical protein
MRCFYNCTRLVKGYIDCSEIFSSLHYAYANQYRLKSINSHYISISHVISACSLSGCAKSRNVQGKTHLHCVSSLADALLPMTLCSGEAANDRLRKRLHSIHVVLKAHRNGLGE